MAGKRTRWIASWLALVALAFLWPQAAQATHYPEGSTCYDCHAVSASRMVPGTRLIKMSQKAIDLGIVGDATIRCLFCHEKNAVSAPYSDTREMQGVLDHFDTTSTSKHPVALSAGTFTPDATALDCLDCHVGLSATVASQTDGSTRIHGIDASGATPVNLYTTLLGGPTTAAAVSANTCQNTLCHDDTVGDDAATGTPPNRHSFTSSVTIDDGTPAAPVGCTDCHGSHNSYQGAALITLRTNGTTSNNLSDALSTLVTPDKCGACHTADDGGAASPWQADGHGRSDIGGGALVCTSCHSASVPHGFSGDATGSNDLRFSLSFSAANTSSLTNKMSESVCLTCHAVYAGLPHGGALNVGCLDCHEAHGKGVGTNIRMIRSQLPADFTSDANGSVLGTNQGVTGTIVFTGIADYYGLPSGSGLCDNVDCHGGVVRNGSAIQPLSTYLTSNNHSAGDLPAEANCAACHSHTDPAGAWKAIENGCDGCHGTPPATNAHLTHTDASLGCNNCHPVPGQGSLTHQNNNAAIQTAADFNNTYNTTPLQIRSNVDITFSGSTLYTTGSYSLAPASRTNTSTFGTCNSSGCHGNFTGGNVANAPAWNGGAAAGACGTCHNATAAIPPTSGNHALHAGQAPNRAFACQLCHAGSYDGTTLLASHLDGNSNNDVVGSGTFNSVAVTMGYTSPNCTTISCHGGYANVAWGAAPSCANCHGTFGVTANGVPMPGATVPKHTGALTNPDGNVNTTLYNSHQGTALLGTNGEGYCDYCHANTQASYLPTMHIDGTIQWNSSMTYQGVSGSTGAAAGCANACHSAVAPYQMSDSGLTLASIAGQGFNCGSCHGDPPTTGAHAAHVIDNGDTDRTDCANCHSGAALYTNAGSPNGNHRNGAVNVFGEWDSATTALGVQWSNNATPANPADDTCTNACHLNDNAVDLPAAVWGATQLDCSSCHYYAAVPTAAANQVLNGCLDPLHERHFGAGGTGWKVCTDCHVVPTPGSGDTAHISAPGAVSDALFYQDRADPAYRGEAAFGRANVTYTSGADDGAGPNNRCSGTGMAAGCHATGTAGTADWDVTAGQQCTFCHTDNTTAAYNPMSGLHDETPTVSGVRHDNALDNASTVGPAGCTECHTDLPSTTHHDGTMDSRANGNRQAAIQFAADVGYTNVAPPSCAPTGALTLATCHSDGGQWGRIWHENADQTTGAECAGCHGTFALGWTAGAGTLARPNMTGVGGPIALTGAHDSDWDGDANAIEVSPNHGGCKSCHGMNSQADKEATYLATTMWDPTGATSAHGDGALQLNGPSADAFAGAVAGGAEYNGNDDAVLETSDWACTNACHSGTGNADHNMGDSGWPVVYADFGAGSCNGCHGYPPLPAGQGGTAGNYIDARAEDYVGGGAGHDAPDHLAPTVTAGDGWTPCQKCHPSTSHAQGGGTVLRANLQVTFPATYNAKSGTATFTAGGAPSAATCAAVSCHGGLVTPAWTGAITVNSDAGCRACHKIEVVANRTAATEYQSAISGGHGRVGSVSLENHTATDASLGDTTDSNLCTHCHNGASVSSQHFGASLDTAALEALADANFVATYDGTGGYISLTNGCAVICHSDTLAGAPQWGRKWSPTITATDGTQCANCHGTFALGWAAGAGILARPNMVGVGGPAALTGPHTADWDGDLTADEVSPYHGICKNCHGMNSQVDKETTYLATTMWDPTGVQSDHGDRRITINGPSAAINLANNAVPAGAEYNGNDDATLEISDFSCTRACHTGASNANHNMGDSGWALNYKDFGSGSCNGCHGYPPLPAGVGGGMGNYLDAATEDYPGGGAGHDTPSHVAPTATAADGWTLCQKCHPDTNHMQGGASVVRGNVQVTMAATYNAKSGTASFTAGAAPTAATCAQVSCHGAQTTPVWSGGTINVNTQCIACHIRENVANRTAATQHQSAISGLHAVTTTVSGKDHWADTAATCGGASSCHLGQPTNHLGATLDTSALDAVNNLRTGVTAASCAIACHSDGGRWARLNDKAKATALITDLVNVCATCHGTFASGWTAGAGTLTRPNMTGVGGPSALTGPHTSNWDGDGVADEVSPNHATCKNCHGMNSQADREATYLATTMWDPTGVQSDHGDGLLTINGPSADDNGQTAAGAEYNANKDGTLEASDYACTKACHQGAGNAAHNMGASGYARAAIEYKDFGSGSCNGCHGYPPLPSGLGGTAGNYLDAGTEDYAGGGAGHDAPDHVAPTVTAADGFTPCLKCHPDSNHMQGGAVVSRANIQVSMQATYNAKSGTATFVPSTGPSAATCTAVSCHGGLATPAWTGAIVVNSDAGCRVCHKIEVVANRTAATEHQSAISGGHGRAGSVSLENHTATDASLGDTTDSNLCTHCHNGASVSSQHFGASLATAALEALADANFVATYDGSGGYISLTNGCAVTCHSDNLAGAPQWGRKWSTTITATNGTECANCHGDFATGWVVGFGPSHNRANMNVTANHEECKMCHVYGDAAYDFVPKWDSRTVGGTSMHGNRQITMNNSATVAYQTASNGCVTVCHANDVGHQLTPGSGWTVQLVAGPGAACTSCHSSTGSAAGVGVFSTSTHAVRGKGATYTTFNGCDDCHPPHSGGVLVANNATVGISYTASGRTGFRLGGTATTGSTTEAEICWNCHNNATYGNTGASAISEWGVNNQAATGASPYNYGALSTPNWTTATWSSSRTQFAYKTGAIQSTHTANPAVTDANLGGANYSKTGSPNAVADIRCSYCHDVHERAQATGDTAAGKPYLRGTWRGNPYEEDGAPRSVYANTAYFSTAAESFGQVPRGIVTPQKIGGYWIDQNNVRPMSATNTTAGTAALNPTSAMTVDQFAGLCALCHGGGNASWTTTEVDNIDQKTGEALWMGANGHANSVKGGTGASSANSFNVFNARGGVTTYSNNPRQHYNGMTDPADNGTWGFRSANNNALRYTPLLSGGNTRPQVYNTDRWVVDETGATKENQYHKFSCSKCHNPHASRLPKLMITNCLDTVHNTWDNQFQMVTASSTLNNNRELAQWTSAQNCHRYSESNNTTTTTPEYRANRLASPAGSGAGWNKVTPWKQTTTTP